MLSFFSIIFYGSFIEVKRLVVREFDIQDDRLPTMKIVVITDIHVGPYKDSKWVQRVVEKINKLDSIDAIFIPGDFVYGPAKIFGSDLAPLKNLNIPLKIATLGNHDHRLTELANTIQHQAVSSNLKKFGIRELKNESFYWTQKGIWIMGMDDNDRQFHSWRQTYLGTDIQPKILLVHSPDIVDELADDQRPNLIISGHTHCGQIRVPGIGALPGTIPTNNGKKYERHLYDLGVSKIFISCGVGEVGPRARLFNPPEIAVLRIN